jgi:transcriptional regulator of aromatic amino acid metabolism
MFDDDLRLAARLHVPTLITAADPDQRDGSARLIHATGDLWTGPFVTCFARTGDLRLQFEHARGGTLFIDDVTIVTAEAQAQLIRLLDSTARPEPPGIRGAFCNVRVIAGASRRLDADRASGRFSEALFYRLNVIHIDYLDEPAVSVAPISRIAGLESLIPNC